VTLVFLQILAILLASRLAGRLVARVGQPRVIGEIVAGIMLGPSLLGWVAPDIFAALFPPTKLEPLYALSQLGLTIFMFLVGTELDVRHLRAQRGAAVTTSAISIAVPFTMGLLLAGTLRERLAPAGVSPLAFGLFIGTALSITAFPVLARILKDHGLTATKIGALALACAAFDDVTGWVILAVVTAVVRSGDGGMILARTMGLLVAYALVMLYLVRPVLARVLARADVSSGERVDDLALVLALALSSALTTEYIGVHALFGAFIAGMAVPRESPVARSARERLEPLTATLLLPLFFAFTGLRTALPLLNEWSLWIDGAAILAVAVIGKAGASTVAARAAGLSWREAQALGILLNTRGLMELVVLNVGMELGILSPALFAMMVVMALVTTGATSPLLRLCRLDTAPQLVNPPYPINAKCELRTQDGGFGQTTP
jgi:Kef-type K+ transport system membrane component KefB